MKTRRGKGKNQKRHARQIAEPLNGLEAALQQRIVEQEDLQHALAPARALPDEGDETLRLQSGDERLVDIDAGPAARMQLERGLAILRDGDAGEAAGLLERGAAQQRGRAAEEGGVPFVEPALRDLVEHLVLGGHAVEGAQILLDRIGIEKDMRRLHQKQLRSSSKK